MTSPSDLTGLQSGVSDSNFADFAHEWTLLQNQFDSYEKWSLVIKLSNIGLLSAAIFSETHSFYILLLMSILWLQDAIWKTFQSRIETRLVQVEYYLSGEGDVNDADASAYQFNRLFLKTRPSNLALVLDYLRQAFRPTVAFPHALLMLIFGVILLS